MRVGLNLVYLVPGETGGTETYGRELIRELVRVAPEVQFTAFVNREAAVEERMLCGEAIATVTVPVSGSNRLQWVRGEQQLLPGAAASAGVDLVHSLANTAPLWGRFRRVTTIHDLHYRRVPEAHLGLKRYGMRVLVPLAARRSHRIITPSQSTADDVASLPHITKEKIDVVAEGVGQERRAAAVPEPELRAWLQDRERPIVLSVSAKRPHKNLARLIDAVATIPTERRPLLVVPGYPTGHESELLARAKELGVEGDVRLLGWIDPPHLEGLYGAAACLVCPSLHEGFGLPVLEAMARGVPVACSAGGALGEVAGPAALVFDPHSVGQIAAAIERILSERELAARLRAAGLERAKMFSWKRTAEETLRVYERALRARA